MLLVLVEPLIPLVSEQFILAKCSIHETIHKRWRQILSGRVYSAAHWRTCKKNTIKLIGKKELNIMKDCLPVEGNVSLYTTPNPFLHIMFKPKTAYYDKFHIKINTKQPNVCWMYWYSGYIGLVCFPLPISILIIRDYCKFHNTNSVPIFFPLVYAFKRSWLPRNFILIIQFSRIQVHDAN